MAKFVKLTKSNGEPHATMNVDNILCVKPNKNQNQCFIEFINNKGYDTGLLVDYTYEEISDYLTIGKLLPH